jgi:hypothetical protein
LILYENRTSRQPERRVQVLLYVSSPCALPTVDTVSRIVAAAATENAARGVTGMLLWADAGFAQRIEGPRATVEGLFARIARDARHRDVRVLARRDGAPRAFPDAPMACARLSEGDNWRLLQRRACCGQDGFAAWLDALMLRLRATA